jgi:hypothetical protein
MKKILFSAVLIVLAVSLWGQSNELLDQFLERETADVATSLLLIAQASGNLPLDTVNEDGYAWALEQDFGKYVKKFSPDDSITLGLYYLALFKSFHVKGGGMFNTFGTPRYAVMEAGFKGYVEPSSVYTDRLMPPYEVLTGITYVTEEVAGGEK